MAADDLDDARGIVAQLSRDGRRLRGAGRRLEQLEQRDAAPVRATDESTKGEPEPTKKPTAEHREAGDGTSATTERPQPATPPSRDQTTETDDATLSRGLLRRRADD